MFSRMTFVFGNAYIEGLCRPGWHAVAPNDSGEVTVELKLSSVHHLCCAARLLQAEGEE